MGATVYGAKVGGIILRPDLNVSILPSPVTLGEAVSTLASNEPQFLALKPLSNLLPFSVGWI